MTKNSQAIKDKMDLMWMVTEEQSRLLKDEQRHPRIVRTIDERWDRARELASVRMEILENQKQDRPNRKQEASKPIELCHSAEGLLRYAVGMFD